ncbi:MAG TPA: antibiotic biosynthesis monooxygenase [Acidimicrobiales bacterium]
MESGEWCAIVHVDIGMRTGLEVVEDALRALVAGSTETAGTVEIVALRMEGKPNHFEVIGRFASESAYKEHLVSSSNLAFRSMVASVLGSPYEDRLHGPRGDQRWPVASIDDFVVVTQIEARPTQLDAALPAFDGFVAEQSSAEGLLGQVALQRPLLPNNLEVVSVWANSEAFEQYLESDGARSVRAELEEELLAPVDNRRYALIAGVWSVP